MALSPSEWRAACLPSPFGRMKATSHFTIFMHGMREKGKIQRNNYRHGSCGSSLGAMQNVWVIRAGANGIWGKDLFYTYKQWGRHIFLENIYTGQILSSFTFMNYFLQ